MEKLIIAGAGPAGISAALYAVRSGITPLIIHKGIGALEKAAKIENYYGLSSPLSGQELYDNGLAQITALGVPRLPSKYQECSGVLKRFLPACLPQYL